jgi:hypothetical protein
MRHKLHRNAVIAVPAMGIKVFDSRRTFDKRFLPLGFEVQSIREDHASFRIGAAGNNFLDFSVRLLVHPAAKDSKSSHGFFVNSTTYSLMIRADS